MNSFKKTAPKIVLLGYMGSGKTSIGKFLAQKVQLEFMDLDDYIESKEQMTIAAIFKNKGEIYFRQREAAYLQEILESELAIVLSVGGGTPCYGNNMNLIKDHATSFYLQASIATLGSRLIKEKDSRPLIAALNADDLDEFIAKHLFERRAFYELAHHRINVSDNSIEVIVDEIVALVE